MKTTLTILFILNTIVIILFTYFCIDEIEHHASMLNIILFIALTAVSVFTLSRLYFRYINRPVKNTNFSNKKRES